MHGHKHTPQRVCTEASQRGWRGRAHQHKAACPSEERQHTEHNKTGVWCRQWHTTCSIHWKCMLGESNPGRRRRHGENQRKGRGKRPRHARGPREGQVCSVQCKCFSHRHPPPLSLFFPWEGKTEIPPYIQTPAHSSSILPSVFHIFLFFIYRHQFPCRQSACEVHHLREKGEKDNITDRRGMSNQPK